MSNFFGGEGNDIYGGTSNDDLMNGYGGDDESRHLLHIGMTRAAHQLWILVTGTPSPLLPRAAV